MNDYDVMLKTGKNDKMFVTYDSAFTNTDTLFVEFEDVLECCEFKMIYELSKHGIDLGCGIFDTSKVEEIFNNLEKLFKWYFGRGIKTSLCNLDLLSGALEYYEKNFYDNNYDIATKSYILASFITEESLKRFKDLIFFNNRMTMNFYNTLQATVSQTLIKRIFVYSSYEDEELLNIIKDDVIDSFGDKIIFVHGDMQDIISSYKITNNSTFVFSDMRNIYELSDANILNGSSILVPYGYGYNMVDPNTYYVDINELLTPNCIFKFNFFDNITG